MSSPSSVLRSFMILPPSSIARLPIFGREVGYTNTSRRVDIESRKKTLGRSLWKDVDYSALARNSLRSSLADN